MRHRRGAQLTLCGWGPFQFHHLTAFNKLQVVLHKSEDAGNIIIINIRVPQKP